MTNGPAAEPNRESLTAFLARLDTEESAHARAAAEAIDELEKRTFPVRGIERQLLPYFCAAAVAFVVGLILFFAGKDSFFGLFKEMDNLGITLLLIWLPILICYYAFRVRWRTRADARAFELNQRYFLPHGGIYFPSSAPGEQACVIRIDPKQGWKPRPSKYDNVRPGAIW